MCRKLGLSANPGPPQNAVPQPSLNSNKDQSSASTCQTPGSIMNTAQGQGQGEFINNPLKPQICYLNHSHTYPPLLNPQAVPCWAPSLIAGNGTVAPLDPSLVSGLSCPDARPTCTARFLFPNTYVHWFLPHSRSLCLRRVSSLVSGQAEESTGIMPAEKDKGVVVCRQYSHGWHGWTSPHWATLGTQSPYHGPSSTDQGLRGRPGRASGPGGGDENKGMPEGAGLGGNNHGPSYS